MDTQSIITELEQERDRLTQAIDALTASQAAAKRRDRRGRKPGRHLTAAERANISTAMKNRAAERKKDGKQL